MGSPPDIPDFSRRISVKADPRSFPLSPGNGVLRSGAMTIPARQFMPVIRDALESGQHVRMTARGSSMFPFIRGGDVVALEPLETTPVVGDIVLAQCASAAEGERYVLHRVVRVGGGAFFLRGDSQKDCEGPFLREDILGRATLVIHNGREHRLDRGIYRLAGLSWNRCAPLNIWIFQLIRRFQEKRG
ncbi:MAG: S24/S26 family peptidase [Syntrophobacter sp.]